jgi:hypothetical protein
VTKVIAERDASAASENRTPQRDPQGQIAIGVLLSAMKRERGTSVWDCVAEISFQLTHGCTCQIACPALPAPVFCVMPSEVKVARLTSSIKHGSTQRFVAGRKTDYSTGNVRSTKVKACISETEISRDKNSRSELLSSFPFFR